MNTLTLDHLPEGTVCTFDEWRYQHWTEAPPLHNHTFHEFFWVTSGAGVHFINGETRPLEAGMLVLTRADDVHGFSGPPSGGEALRFINFAFPVKLWVSLRRRHAGLAGKWFDEPDHRARELLLDLRQLERLRHLATDLSLGAHDAFSTECLLTGMVGMLANVGRWKARDALPDWLATACAAIREPEYFVHGTPALARLAGCSPAHLAREVRRHLQCTPTDLVNEARILYASQQLATTRRPVLDIAAECGFENLGHFYKLFRASHGISPVRYRKREQGIAPAIADARGPGTW